MKISVLKLHRALALFGFAAMLLWGASGLLHPWLTTFGVQQAVFAPPQRALNLNQALPFQQLLKQTGIEQAQSVRLAVGESANLLQVTESQFAPRRYFDLNTGLELPDHDPVYAAFLARHYLNAPYAEIAKVERIDTFSNDYPSVNRLLPVYRVQFDRPDGLNAYVYTETASLAAVSDNTKHRVQTAFQWLHTWSWMPKAAETPRVLLIAMLVGVLFTMACSGLAMLVLIRRKVRTAGAKGWHRIAGYALVVPVLMFSFSGVYHVVQHGWPEEQSKLAMRPAIQLQNLDFAIHSSWAEITRDLQVTGLSLVANQNGELLYRLALPNPKNGLPDNAQAIRTARFDGVQPTGPAVYLNAKTGILWQDGDREMAHQLAQLHTGLPREAVQQVSLVTRFGGDYDFRNKRLPVWKFEYGAPLNASVFVDTATGVLADITLNSAKPEIWSFSMLHKWSFLGGLGRNVQNIVMCVVVVLAMVMMAGFGLRSRRSVAR
ncbi:hypothetical protein [Limnobacter sp. MED105]|uniref:hypothetical protein n=1 Tax=Limnobacter sp. MED105 TaxID=391597 RepID=UPI0012EA3349|nr:hypothetical protein [Limnobacter sp. MED105]